MSICAFYYGQSVSDVDALTHSADVKYIVLNNGYSPTHSSTIQAIVDRAHANQTAVLGYVDSGSANMPTHPPYHPSDLLSGPCGSGSYTGCTCSVITRAASKPIVNEAGGYWNHRVYDSADFDLSKNSFYSWYFPYTYCGGTTKYNLRKQSLATTGASCATLYGYMKDHVDNWLRPKGGSGYGADGIMFDNCYAGSYNDKPRTSDSRYAWYKKVCSDVHKRYPGSVVLLNNGNSAPPQWWFTLEAGDPFFDLMNIGEVPYNGTETNYPPNYGPGGKFPAYVMNKAYQKHFVSVLHGAKGISAAHTQNWYKACKASGIEYGFISTGSYGSFSLKPTNLPDQFAAVKP
ncbi:MAG TPA: hypothetical protein VL485_13595 [Ktedonobacteraceae bacterium]|nr:hypothetical protein [Ktedonobacteraceae bacterium]